MMMSSHKLKRHLGAVMCLYGFPGKFGNCQICTFPFAITIFHPLLPVTSICIITHATSFQFDGMLGRLSEGLALTNMLPIMNGAFIANKCVLANTLSLQ